MLWALRAENRAHWYARPESGVYRWAKRILKEAFVPASAKWRAKSVRDGIEAIDRGLSALAAEQPAIPEQSAIGGRTFAIPTRVG
jgi:hypothetical protein